MRYSVNYQYRRAGSSAWSNCTFVVTATSDYMAEKCIQSRHPGCEVMIKSIKEL